MAKGLADYCGLMYRYELQRDETGGFFARHPDLPGCTSGGETAGEAIENLDEARLLWIEARLASGQSVPEPQEEYKGKLSLRLPASLHARLAERAAREGASINQLITVAVTSALSTAEAEGRLLPHLARMEAAIDQLGKKSTARRFADVGNRQAGR